MNDIEIKSVSFGTLCNKDDKQCTATEITLKNNPYANIKDYPTRFCALKGEKQVGAVNIFPTIVVADNEEYNANCGSGLSVSKEVRGKGIGKRLAICRMNASPDNISIGAGLSSMSYPLYKKLGCLFFHSPRLGLFVNPRKILQSYFGCWSILINPIVSLIISILTLSLYSRNSYIKEKYNICKLAKANNEIEEIVENDNHRFCEKHSKEWFNWHINYNFSTKEYDRNFLYAIKNQHNEIEAFFMFKARIKDNVTTRHINNVQVISLIEWGIKNGSAITEKDIVASFLDTAKKMKADIVEVSFLSSELMKQLKRIGFIKILDGRIMLYAGDKSPLRQHKGWDKKENWRLRPAYSDYGFC